MSSNDHRENAWTFWHFAGAVAMVALGAYLTRAAWLSIWQITKNDVESSHIYLVAIAFPWLVMDRKELFARCRPRGQWLGLLMIVAGAGLHIYGYDYEYDVFWHGGALLVIVGGLISVLGSDVFFKFFPAFVVLGFLLPIPGGLRGQISVPLQTIMATITEEVGQVMGIGISREGNELIVNGKTVNVAEACNGMRMVFALFLVSYTFAFVNQLKTWLQLLVFVMAPVFALLCNVFRMVPTVWFYGHTSEEFAHLFHDWAGWGMIFVGLMFLMGMIRVLEWTGLPVTVEDASLQSKSDADLNPPVSTGALQQPCYSLRRSIGVMAVALLMFGGLGLLLQPRRMPTGLAQYHEAIQRVSDTFPTIVGEWYGKDVDVPAQAINTLKPNVMISRRYSNLRTGNHFTFMLIHCADARSIEDHFPKHCYVMSGWTIESADSVVWTIDGWDVHLTEYAFMKEHLDGDERITVSNFMILPTGEFEPDMESVKAFARSPYKRHYGAGQTQFVFAGSTTVEQRKQVLETFMSANRPLFEKILKGAPL